MFCVFLLAREGRWLFWGLLFWMHGALHHSKLLLFYRVIYMHVRVTRLNDVGGSWHGRACFIVNIFEDGSLYVQHWCWLKK